MDPIRLGENIEVTVMPGIHGLWRATGCAVSFTNGIITLSITFDQLTLLTKHLLTNEEVSTIWFSHRKFALESSSKFILWRTATVPKRSAIGIAGSFFAVRSSRRTPYYWYHDSIPMEAVHKDLFFDTHATANVPITSTIPSLTQAVTNLTSRCPAEVILQPVICNPLRGDDYISWADVVYEP